VQRPGLDDRGAPGGGQVRARLPGAVGGVAEDLKPAVLADQQFQPGYSLMVGFAAGLGEPATVNRPVPGSIATWAL
jgi:hypothetical protein